MIGNSSTPLLTIISHDLITNDARTGTFSTEKTYHFSINSHDFGKSSIDAGTRNVFIKTVFEIADDLNLGERNKSEIENKIRALGEKMYKFLIPHELSEYFNDDRHKSITIRTSEQDLPWELICDASGFLCHRIAIGREIPDNLNDSAKFPRPTLNICLIGNPTQDLDAASEEVADLESKFAEILTRLQNDYEIKPNLKVYIGQAANRHNVLFETIASSDIQWDIIHYAGHADLNQANPDSSSLLLSDCSLRCYEIEKVLSSRPMVFINSCYSGSVVQSNSNFGVGILKGMANSFVKGGATGYLGSIWPVSDLIAKSISEKFYESVLDGEGIGNSLMIAKSNAYDQGNDLTSIGYVLYGDPNAKLPLFEPPLTHGPFINSQGFDRIFQLEQEYSALEILLANDLPWILWRSEDFVSWVKRIPGSEKTRNIMAIKLIEYRRHFKNLILTGKKTFIGITNLKTLQVYLQSKSSEAKLELLSDLKEFAEYPNFVLLFYQGDEEEIEEIEIVSKHKNVFLNLSESVYVFNKQVRYEQKPVNYSLNLDFNPNLIRQYADRFYNYYDNNIIQYETRISNSTDQALRKDDYKSINSISVNILEENILS